MINKKRINELESVSVMLASQEVLKKKWDNTCDDKWDEI